MKSAIVLLLTALLALTIVLGAPVGLAQDNPDDAPPTDQTCPPMDPDMPPPDDAPVCTPTPDTSQPSDAPTATPVPVSTDTPSPVPSDTPTAAPTDTPTPPPANPTPSPTSGSKPVPGGTLARQLPFENPGDQSCDIILDSADQPPCDPQTFPAVFTIQFSPFSSSAPITVQVDSRKPQTISAMTWDVLSVPGGVPTGGHTITASETYFGSPISARLQLRVLPATSPHFLVYPRTVAPGSNAQVWLAGFAANADVPLGLYRERSDCKAFAQRSECYELARDLGTVTTAADGTARRLFSIAPDDQRTAYLIASAGLRISTQNTADALRALGKPWFVVDQP